MKRFVIFLIALLAMSLACNLSNSDEEATPQPNETPTTPSVQNPPPVVNNPTVQVSNPPVSTEDLPEIEDSEFFVLITSPAAGSRVNKNGFTVRGQQRGSFENNVVVQSRDAGGNVIQEVSTTAVGELGQVGTWEVTLAAPTVPDGSIGSVYAFYTSPRDGGEQAFWQIEVTYTNQ